VGGVWVTPAVTAPYRGISRQYRMTKGRLRGAMRKTPLGREALLVEVQPRPPRSPLRGPERQIRGVCMIAGGKGCSNSYAATLACDHFAGTRLLKPNA
jgi:hypothetical protein